MRHVASLPLRQPLSNGIVSGTQAHNTLVDTLSAEVITEDENGIVVKLGWISGSLTKFQSFSPSLSWTPKDSGVYTAEIYVWDSLLHQDALTNVTLLEIITS